MQAVRQLYLITVTGQILAGFHQLGTVYGAWISVPGEADVSSEASQISEKSHFIVIDPGSKTPTR
jgi:hypothetical protein